MATSTLMLHKGAREVSRQEVEAVGAPEATKTWFPVRHGDVINTVEARLQDAGFAIAKARYALSPDDARFFGTLDLTTPVAQGVTLAVGVRNSSDKTFPIGWACGNRVFTCDNLSFSAELVISRKHTRFGARRFNDRLSQAILELKEFRAAEERRVDAMRYDDLSDERADALMLRAFEVNVVNTQLLPKVIREYRHPRHEEFYPRTTWSLLNAFTEVLKERLSSPAVHAAATIKLQGSLYREPVTVSPVL